MHVSAQVSSSVHSAFVGGPAVSGPYGEISIASCRAIRMLTPLTTRYHGASGA